MREFAVPRSLDFLRPPQREGIGARLREPGDTYVDQIMESGGIDQEQALLVLMTMESAGLCRVYRDIFHRCSMHPVSKRLYRNGLPAVPWECPECEQVVEEVSDLTFEVFGRFSDAVSVV